VAASPAISWTSRCNCHNNRRDKERTMPKSIHVLALGSLIATGAIVAATSANAQSPAVVFHGLPHTAVGGATLRLDPARDALDVTPLDPAGGGGVAVALGEATSWTASIGAIPFRAFPLKLSWSAIADGQRISTAVMKQAGESLEVSALFTGAARPAYSAQVYDDGRLVGAIGSLPRLRSFSARSDACLPTSARAFQASGRAC
jgi:hypothetical protein